LEVESPDDEPQQEWKLLVAVQQSSLVDGCHFFQMAFPVFVKAAAMSRQLPLVVVAVSVECYEMQQD
jgi:hypothetical protein